MGTGSLRLGSRKDSTDHFEVGVGGQFVQSNQAAHLENVLGFKGLGLRSVNDDLLTVFKLKSFEDLVSEN